MADEPIEETLHIARAVDVFSIPPRAPTGWRSGEWLVSNKLFTGRLRVVGRGLDCEIRLEDAATDQLFAACPVAYGMRTVCVEPVVDSSRYFVLRVEDPGTKRHAFLGMGFQERGDAFDFNESLIRHEKFVERSKASSQLASGGDTAAGTSAAGKGGRTPAMSAQAAAATQEVAALYRPRGDLALKEGQTIHVNVKAPANKPAGTSTAAAPLAGVPPVPVAAAGPGLFKLAPPPADLLSGGPPPAPPAVAAHPAPAVAPPPSGAAQSIDLLDWGSVPAPAPAAPLAQPKPQEAPPAPADGGWAVFD